MCQTPQSNAIYSWGVRMVEQPQINKYTYIKKLKVKNHMIISIYAEKYLTFFHNKILNKLGRNGMYFKKTKAIREKLIANFIFNDEILKIFLYDQEQYPSQN